jgi:hypothetical protein
MEIKVVYIYKYSLSDLHLFINVYISIIGWLVGWYHLRLRDFWPYMKYINVYS